MISSVSNAQVKNVAALAKRAKVRREQELFVVEGSRMFAELPKDRVHKVFVTESFIKQKEKKVLLKDYDYETVSDDVLRVMSDTQTPQGILALVKQYSYSLDQVTGSNCGSKGRTMLMILETIQDPGNLGTILRAGEGAGVTGLIMDGSTADIYNPKVIRSTMGSIFRVPFVYVDDLKQAVAAVKKQKICLYASHLEAAVLYDVADYTGDIGFFVGNEANGLSDEIAALADARIKIPMLGQVESLNAAVAASVLMYEAARQRRHQ